VGGLTLAFVIVPSIGACLATWVLRDWRLAGAVASGGAGLLVLGANTPLPFMGLMLPLLAGAVVGALVAAVMLVARPTGSLWTRLSVSLSTAFVLFYAYMATFAQGEI